MLDSSQAFLDLYQFHFPNVDITAGTRYVRTTSTSISMLKENAKPISRSIMLLNRISKPREPARIFAAAVMFHRSVGAYKLGHYDITRKNRLGGTCEKTESGGLNSCGTLKG